VLLADSSKSARDVPGRLDGVVPQRELPPAQQFDGLFESGKERVSFSYPQPQQVRSTPKGILIGQQLFVESVTVPDPDVLASATERDDLLRKGCGGAEVLLSRGKCAVGAFVFGGS